MNYLIFGGEGFIGKHLSNYIKQQYLVNTGSIYSIDIIAHHNKQNSCINADVGISIQLPQGADIILSLGFKSPKLKGNAVALRKNKYEI